MNREQVRSRCLTRPGAEEDFPFGDGVAVMKVMGKVFALIPVDGPTSMSLKCDPHWAKALRTTYKAVTPGYHLNKEHWNTIAIDGSIPDEELFEMIDESYALVVKGLPKTQRQIVEQLSSRRE